MIARRAVPLACLLALWLTALPPVAAQYRADILADIDTVESKLVSLAQAIPQDEMTWRPTPEVRSISEALMHTAAANFFLPTVLGVDIPDDIRPAEIEQISDRDAVVATLQRSFAQLRKMVEASRARKLDDTVNMFGRPTSVAGALHNAVTHSHEHLGQVIAYGRSVGVAPPWSSSEP